MVSEDQQMYISCFLILVGSIIMALSVLKFKKLFPIIKSLQTKASGQLLTLFKAHIMLMIFFLIGYIIVGIALYFKIHIISDIFVGLIFMFGAFFVFLGIRIQLFMNNEQKKAEVEIIKSHKSVLQSEKMSGIGQIAAGVAHEVNNPLTSILGYTQLILNKHEPGDAEYEQLKIIETSKKMQKYCPAAACLFAYKSNDVSVCRHK